MNNTREIKAVSEAISNTIIAQQSTTIGFYTEPENDQMCVDGHITLTPIAQAAIAASDSRYIKGLVEALKKAISYIDADNLTMQSVVAELKEALQQLPEDLR
jgi:hypothetical protein